MEPVLQAAADAADPPRAGSLWSPSESPLESPMTSPPQLGYTAPMPVLMDEWVTVEVSFDKYTPRLGIDAPKMPRMACITRVSSTNDIITMTKRYVSKAASKASKAVPDV